jgi:hypothetical protein
MIYAIEMGSDAMIYVTEFHKNRYRHSEVNGSSVGIHRQGKDRIRLN